MQRVLSNRNYMILAAEVKTKFLETEVSYLQGGRGESHRDNVISTSGLREAYVSMCQSHASDQKFRRRRI